MSSKTLKEGLTIGQTQENSRQIILISTKKTANHKLQNLTAKKAIIKTAMILL